MSNIQTLAPDLLSLLWKPITIRLHDKSWAGVLFDYSALTEENLLSLEELFDDCDEPEEEMEELFQIGTPFLAVGQSDGIEEYSEGSLSGIAQIDYLFLLSNDGTVYFVDVDGTIVPDSCDRFASSVADLEITLCEC